MYSVLCLGGAKVLMLITFLVHPLLHVMWRPGVSGLKVMIDQGVWPRVAET